jgi:GAF domain-containing protein
LFGGTQNALAEVQNIYRQDIAMSWVKFAKAGGIVGYHKTLSEGKLINKAVDTDEIRQTMMRGNVTAFNADEKRTESTLVVPVKLRGQVIGVLNIRAPRKEHQWSFDEIGLVEAISERLALALENARLFEETAKRAERERRITDITTKIRSTTDPQQMIDTAIEELRQALGATHVEVVPQRLSDMTDK